MALSPRASKKPVRRGMTVFVVLLVISMLGAVGVFAARSAQLGVTNAGRYREMVQTHYIAEAGMHGAVSEFGRDPHGYLVKLRTPPTIAAGVYPCKDIPYSTVTPSFEPASTHCLKIGYEAVQESTRIRSGNGSFLLFNPKGYDATYGSVPGSFGTANIAGNFSVEFTDERPVEPPPAGMPVSGGGGSTMKFKSVTARSIGQVIPTDDSGAPLASTDEAFKYATSIETIRAEIVVGPVP